jgi:hypothetical protein
LKAWYASVELWLDLKVLEAGWLDVLGLAAALLLITLYSLLYLSV